MWGEGRAGGQQEKSAGKNGEQQIHPHEGYQNTEFLSLGLPESLTNSYRTSTAKVNWGRQGDTLG